MVTICTKYRAHILCRESRDRADTEQNGRPVYTTKSVSSRRTRCTYLKTDMAEASFIAKQGVENGSNPVQWAVEKGRKAWSWISDRFSGTQKDCANCGKRAFYHLPNSSIFCYCGEECYSEFTKKTDCIRREEPLCCLPGCPKPCYRDKTRGLVEFCCKKHLVQFRENHQSTELFMILKRQKETVYVGQLPKRLRKTQDVTDQSTTTTTTTTTTLVDDKTVLNSS